MTHSQNAWDNLGIQIEQARALIADLPYSSFDTAVNPAPDASLKHLIDECQDLVKSAPNMPKPKVRLLHHFACTGGTLVARCLGVMPNVQLLSEVDPLSTQSDAQKFRPTDLAFLARSGTRPTDAATTVAIFQAGLDIVMEQAQQKGLQVVLRDHPHSMYCHDSAVPDRPTLRAIIKDKHPVLSLVTLRHPLDSYLSLMHNGWVHFTPHTLEEYAQRMTRFLSDHDTSPHIRYEDILADPAKEIANACHILDLTFKDNLVNLTSDVPLSGDSGRSGSKFTVRTRRPVSQTLAQETRDSPTYTALCVQLGYNPDPAAAPV